MYNLQDILNKFLDSNDAYKGLYAVYILDTRNKDSVYKIFDRKKYNKSKTHDALKSIVGLLKYSDFDRVVIELDERYFIKRVVGDIFIFIIGDKNEPLGKTFAQASNLKIS